MGGSVNAELTAWTVLPNNSKSVSTGGVLSLDKALVFNPEDAEPVFIGGGQRGNDILYERNVREAAVPREDSNEECADLLRSRSRRAEEGCNPPPPPPPPPPPSPSSLCL